MARRPKDDASTSKRQDRANRDIDGDHQDEPGEQGAAQRDIGAQSARQRQAGRRPRDTTDRHGRDQTGVDQVLLNLCCHAPRARKAYAMARAAGFVHVTIVPINFGKASLMTRLKWFVYDTIEIAGLHFGPARKLARGLRLKHLAAARHAAKQSN